MVKQQAGSTLYINTVAEGDWTQGHLAKHEFAKQLDVKINPTDKLDNIHGVMQFAAYVGNFVKSRELNELLQTSDVVGNIRFSRPTVYIFPGCQGDSTLFGINGFNLLVNGGYSRKACFWDLTRHLDRIDAALMTHLGSDNLFGFQSVMQRKSIETIHPEIGFMYVNASDKIKALTDSSENEKKEANLFVNLAEEGGKIIQLAKQVGQDPQPCSRPMSGQTVEPTNLYHKVGIGSLDMYILNPITDSKELKDFYQQWNQCVATFGSNQHLPLPNTLSVCALLVWKPSDPNDNITRIFFPGNAPQHKVIEGLEKLKSLDILKHPVCTKASLHAKPAKRPASAATKPPARPKASPVSTPRTETPEKIKKETAPKAAAPPKPRPAPLQKVKKEENNKKTMKGPEKKEEKPAEKKPEKPKTEKAPPKEKPLKSTPSKPTSASKTPTKAATPSKPSSAPAKSTPSKGSSKSSSASSSKGSTSPIKEPEKKIGKATKEAVPELVKVAPEPLVDHFPEANGSHEPLIDTTPVEEPQHEAPEADQAPASPLIDTTPDTLPEPEVPVEDDSAIAMDKDQMRELGIYDEDEDIEGDLDAQQQQAAQQSFGGMADSMHEDLMGGFSNQDPMQGSFHGDLMTGSMHESMFDNNQPFDGQIIMENGGSNVDDLTPEEETTSEDTQPQALPDPVAYVPESFSKEPDVIPVMAGKDEYEVKQESSLPLQEPDLLATKQDSDVSELLETSTVPVENNVPPMLDTPDEVENALPEDDEIVDSEDKDFSKDSMVDKEPHEIDDIKDEIDELENDKEDIPEPIAEPVPVEEPVTLPHTQPEIQCMPEDQFDEEVEEPVTLPQTQPEIQRMPEDQFDEEAEDFMKESLDEPLESQIPEPMSDSVDLPQSIDERLNDETDIDQQQETVERPLTPEPVEAEQIEQSKEEKTGPIEPFDSVEDEPIHCDDVGADGHFDKENDAEENELNEQVREVDTYESEEDRAGSPDSQVGAQDSNRDSLERDVEMKEQSPEMDSVQRDSMDRESEPRDSMERDSEERSVERDSEERDSIEKEIKHDTKPEFDQRQDLERSYEIESEETEETDEDEEEEEEESSYDQEENTDEKCLIQGSVGEDQPMKQVDHMDAPVEFDQKTDSMLSPESEYTDASHGGQVGYHQMDEQDGDSVDDIEADEKQMSPVMQKQNPFGEGFEQFGAPSYHSGPMNTNPFGNVAPAMNPFDSYGHRSQEPANNYDEDSPDEEYAAGGPMNFDPLSQWGKPMGLPSPAPPEVGETAAPAPKKDNKKAAGTKRPASATKPTASNGVPEKSKSANLNSTKISVNTSRLSMGGKTRPGSAPAKNGEEVSKSKQNGTKRPATATSGSKTAPAGPKMPPLPAFTPFYLDMTYIPAHGNPNYCDVEFFKRVRARRYVLSSLSPNTQILDALLEGKSTWEDKSLPVTVIPTYDNENLHHWMSLHKEKLTEAHVDIAPSASRCTIQLQDHETSASAYRLEFQSHTEELNTCIHAPGICCNDIL